MVEEIINDLGFPPYVLGLITLAFSILIFMLSKYYYKRWIKDRSNITRMWFLHFLLFGTGILSFSLGYFGLNSLVPDLGNDLFTIISFAGVMVYVIGAIMVFSRKWQKRLIYVPILLFIFQFIESGILQTEGFTYGTIFMIIELVIVALVFTKGYFVTKEKRFLLIPIYNLISPPSAFFISQPQLSLKLIGFLILVPCAYILYIGLKKVPTKYLNFEDYKIRV